MIIAIPEGVTVTQIGTQGRKTNNQWVKAYHVHISVDGVDYTEVTGDRSDGLFTGNTDRSTKVWHNIGDPADLSVWLAVTGKHGNFYKMSIDAGTPSLVGAHSYPTMYFSDYAYRSGNVRYLSIFNAGPGRATLADFALAHCADGCSGSKHERWIPLSRAPVSGGPDNGKTSAYLEAGEVYSVSHNNAGNCDSTIDGTAGTVACYEMMDQACTATHYCNYWDINDPWALATGTDASPIYIDHLGDVTSSSAKNWEGCGATQLLRNKRIQRKTTVTKGNTWEHSAGLSGSGHTAEGCEWIVTAIDASSPLPGLGTHGGAVTIDDGSIALAKVMDISSNQGTHTIDISVDRFVPEDQGRSDQFTSGNCLAAAVLQFGSKVTATRSTMQGPTSWGHIPKGCSVQSNSGAGDWAAHFSTHTTGYRTIPLSGSGFTPVTTFNDGIEFHDSIQLKSASGRADCTFGSDDGIAFLRWPVEPAETSEAGAMHRINVRYSLPKPSCDLRVAMIQSPSTLGASAFVGCYNDVPARDPALHGVGAGRGWTSDDMTPALCRALCAPEAGKTNSTVYGLTAGRRCRCGAGYDFYRHGTSATCTTPCSGDAAVKCGGPIATEVYRFVGLAHEASTQTIRIQGGAPVDHGIAGGAWHQAGATVKMGGSGVHHLWLLSVLSQTKGCEGLVVDSITIHRVGFSGNDVATILDGSKDVLAHPGWAGQSTNVLASLSPPSTTYKTLPHVQVDLGDISWLPRVTLQSGRACSLLTFSGVAGIQVLASNVSHAADGQWANVASFPDLLTSTVTLDIASQKNISARFWRLRVTATVESRYLGSSESITGIESAPLVLPTLCRMDVSSATPVGPLVTRDDELLADGITTSGTMASSFQGRRRSMAPGTPASIESPGGYQERLERPLGAFPNITALPRSIVRTHRTAFDQFNKGFTLLIRSTGTQSGTSRPAFCAGSVADCSPTSIDSSGATTERGIIVGGYGSGGLLGVSVRLADGANMLTHTFRGSTPLPPGRLQSTTNGCKCKASWSYPDPTPADGLKYFSGVCHATHNSLSQPWCYYDTSIGCTGTAVGATSGIPYDNCDAATATEAPATEDLLVRVLYSPTSGALETDTLTRINDELQFAEAHGLSVNTAVVYTDNGVATIGQLTSGKTYYVLASTGPITEIERRMKLSLTPGGAAIVIPSNGGAIGNKITFGGRTVSVFSNGVAVGDSVLFTGIMGVLYDGSSGFVLGSAPAFGTELQDHAFYNRGATSAAFKGIVHEIAIIPVSEATVSGGGAEQAPALWSDRQTVALSLARTSGTRHVPVLAVPQVFTRKTEMEGEEDGLDALNTNFTLTTTFFTEDGRIVPIRLHSSLPEYAAGGCRCLMSSNGGRCQPLLTGASAGRGYCFIDLENYPCAGYLVFGVPFAWCTPQPPSGTVAAAQDVFSSGYIDIATDPFSAGDTTNVVLADNRGRRELLSFPHGTLTAAPGSQLTVSLQVVRLLAGRVVRFFVNNSLVGDRFVPGLSGDLYGGGELSVGKHMVNGTTFAGSVHSFSIVTTTNEANVDRLAMRTSNDLFVHTFSSEEPANELGYRFLVTEPMLITGLGRVTVGPGVPNKRPLVGSHRVRLWKAPVDEFSTGTLLASVIVDGASPVTDVDRSAVAFLPTAVTIAEGTTIHITTQSVAPNGGPDLASFAPTPASFSLGDAPVTLLSECHGSGGGAFPAAVNVSRAASGTPFFLFTPAIFDPQNALALARTPPTLTTEASLAGAWLSSAIEYKPLVGRWQPRSSTAVGQWIAFDLGSSTTVRRITTTPITACLPTHTDSVVTDARLEYSEDGTWTAVKYLDSATYLAPGGRPISPVSADPASTTTLSITGFTATARHWRVVVLATSGAASKTAGFCEVGLYEDSAARWGVGGVDLTVTANKFMDAKVPVSLLATGSPSFTLAGWVRLTKNVTGAVNSSYYMMTTLPGPPAAAVRISPSGRFAFDNFHKADGSVPIQTMSTKGANINATDIATLYKWHHIVVVMSSNAGGSTIKYYIDGMLWRTGASTSRAAVATGIRIGANPAGDGGFFPGFVDDVAVWTRPLTGTEVVAIFESPVAAAKAEAGPITIQAVTGPGADGYGDTINWMGLSTGKGTLLNDGANGFIGQYQRIVANNKDGIVVCVNTTEPVQAGKVYLLSFRYRASGGITSRSTDQEYGVAPTNTYGARLFLANMTVTRTDMYLHGTQEVGVLRVGSVEQAVGAWIEINQIQLSCVTCAPTGVGEAGMPNVRHVLASTKGASKECRVAVGVVGSNPDTAIETVGVVDASGYFHGVGTRGGSDLRRLVHGWHRLSVTGSEDGNITAYLNGRQLGMPIAGVALTAPVDGIGNAAPDRGAPWGAASNVRIFPTKKFSATAAQELAVIKGRITLKSAPSFCLTLVTGNIVEGAILQMYGCNGVPSEWTRWQHDANGRIRLDANPDFCITNAYDTTVLTPTFAGHSTAGHTIRLWRCSDIMTVRPASVARPGALNLHAWGDVGDVWTRDSAGRICIYNYPFCLSMEPGAASALRKVQLDAKLPSADSNQLWDLVKVAPIGANQVDFEDVWPAPPYWRVKATDGAADDLWDVDRVAFYTTPDRSGPPAKPVWARTRNSAGQVWSNTTGSVDASCRSLYGLVGVWDFGNGFADKVGMGHGLPVGDGANATGATWVSAGSLHLNSNRAVHTAPLQSNMTDFTLEAWVVLPAGSGQPGKTGTLMSVVSTTNPAMYESIEFGTQYTDFLTGVTSSAEDVAGVWSVRGGGSEGKRDSTFFGAECPRRMYDGKSKTHVVFTWSSPVPGSVGGSTPVITAYLDGEVYGTPFAPRTNLFPYGRNNVRIAFGKRPVVPGDGGTLDTIPSLDVEVLEARAFGRALLPHEVKDLYDTQLTTGGVSEFRGMSRLESFVGSSTSSLTMLMCPTASAPAIDASWSVATTAAAGISSKGPAIEFYFGSPVVLQSAMFRTSGATGATSGGTSGQGTNGGDRFPQGVVFQWSFDGTTWVDAFPYDDVQQTRTHKYFENMVVPAVTTTSYGAAWADYDNDGNMDVYVVYGAGAGNKLYHNNGRSGRFFDVTAAQGVSGLAVATSYHAAWGDYDNDGDQDLFVCNGAGHANTLYRNMGAAAFVDVTAETGLGGRPEWDCRSALWVDLDRDGDLDLVIANDGDVNVLFRNDAATGAGVGAAAAAKLFSMESLGIDDRGAARSLVATDVDGDGDDDLLVVNYGAPDVLYSNMWGSRGLPPRRGRLTVRVLEGDNTRLRSVFKVSLFAAGAALGVDDPLETRIVSGVSAVHGPAYLNPDYDAHFGIEPSTNKSAPLPSYDIRVTMPLEDNRVHGSLAGVVLDSWTGQTTVVVNSEQIVVGPAVSAAASSFGLKPAGEGVCVEGNGTTCPDVSVSTTETFKVGASFNLPTYTLREVVPGNVQAAIAHGIAAYLIITRSQVLITSTVSITPNVAGSKGISISFDVTLASQAEVDRILERITALVNNLPGPLKEFADALSVQAEIDANKVQDLFVTEIPLTTLQDSPMRGLDYHIAVGDYDGDGDQEILTGGRYGSSLFRGIKTPDNHTLVDIARDLQISGAERRSVAAFEYDAFQSKCNKVTDPTFATGVTVVVPEWVEVNEVVGTWQSPFGAALHVRLKDAAGLLASSANRPYPLPGFGINFASTVSDDYSGEYTLEIFAKGVGDVIGSYMRCWTGVKWEQFDRPLTAHYERMSFTARYGPDSGGPVRLGPTPTADAEWYMHSPALYRSDCKLSLTYNVTATRSAAFADANGDGTLDLIVSRASPATGVKATALGNMLYVRNGSTFDPIEPSPVGSIDGGEGHSYGAGQLAWADFDGDGAPDLIASQTLGAPLRLYRNVGPGNGGQPRFEDVTEKSGLISAADLASPPGLKRARQLSPTYRTGGTWGEHESVRCTEYGYPIAGIWQADPGCCAIHANAACSDGFLKEQGDVCGAGSWGFAHLTLCKRPAVTDSANMADSLVETMGSVTIRDGTAEQAAAMAGNNAARLVAACSGLVMDVTLMPVPPGGIGSVKFFNGPDAELDVNLCGAVNPEGPWTEAVAGLEGTKGLNVMPDQTISFVPSFSRRGYRFWGFQIKRADPSTAPVGAAGPSPTAQDMVRVREVQVFGANYPASQSATWCDFDYDGDPDVFVARMGGKDNLYRNNGNGTFTDVAVQAGVAGDGNVDTQGGSWGDFNNDGWPDLYIATTGKNRLLENMGDGTFRQLNNSGLVASGVSSSAAWGDINQDGLLDLFVASDGGPNFVFTQRSGATVASLAALAVDEYNRTGRANTTNEKFVSLQVGPATGDKTLAVALADLDNDGDLDMYSANYGTGNRLYLNSAGNLTATGNALLRIHLLAGAPGTFGSRGFMAASGETLHGALVRVYSLNTSTGDRRIVASRVVAGGAGAGTSAQYTVDLVVPQSFSESTAGARLVAGGGMVPELLYEVETRLPGGWPLDKYSHGQLSVLSAIVLHKGKLTVVSTGAMAAPAVDRSTEYVFRGGIRTQERCPGQNRDDVCATTVLGWHINHQRVAPSVQAAASSRSCDAANINTRGGPAATFQLPAWEGVGDYRLEILDLKTEPVAGTWASSMEGNNNAPANFTVELFVAIGDTDRPAPITVRCGSLGDAREACVGPLQRVLSFQTDPLRGNAAVNLTVIVPHGNNAGGVNRTCGIDMVVSGRIVLTKIEEKDEQEVISLSDETTILYILVGGAFSLLNKVDLASSQRVTFVDIDADNKFDMVVVDSTMQKAYMYKATGSGRYTGMTEAVNPIAGINFYTRGNPSWFDVDDDGDLDLFVTFIRVNPHPSKKPYFVYSVTHFYRNIGNATSPDFNVTGGPQPVPSTAVMYLTDYYDATKLLALNFPTCANTDHVEQPPTSGGTGKVCRACADGMGPNADRSDCQNCTTGTHGVSGTCTLCPAGRSPTPSRTACTACGPGRAGALGSCGACGDGTTNNANRSACVLCDVTSAGTGGDCTACSNGTEGNAARTACVSCVATAAGSSGVCATCPAGKTSSSDRTQCQLCLASASSAGAAPGACATCPDGTTASADRTNCDVPCAATEQGIAGVCTTCPLGKTAAPDRKSCVLCGPKARGAVGGGSCVNCADGHAGSSNRSTCELCPLGFAGTGGVCNKCPDGSMPVNSARVSVALGAVGCAACPTGQAGSNGTCAQCADGAQPNFDRTVCQVCPRALYGTSGICFACAHGSSPSSDHTSCGTCAAGHAGKWGVCDICKDGTFPSTDKSECLPCPAPTYGTSGACTGTCGDGTEQNPSKTGCDSCVATHYGLGGTCGVCADATSPNGANTACVDCVAGRGGTLGACDACDAGRFQPAAGQLNCLSCASGRFQSATGRSACASCGAGTHQENTGKAACAACLPGKFQDWGDSLIRRTTSGITQYSVMPTTTTVDPGNGAVVFKVRGDKNVYLGLLTAAAAFDADFGSGSSEAMYELVYGGDRPGPISNAMYWIARTSGGFARASLAPPGGNIIPASTSSARWFWGQAGIDGTVRMGTGSQVGANQVVSWQDAAPLQITRFAIRTLGTALGDWAIVNHSVPNSCTECPVGRYQAGTAQTDCLFCANGTTTTATEGKDVSMCVGCPAGMAGTMGVCTACEGALVPSSDKTSCVVAEVEEGDRRRRLASGEASGEASGTQPGGWRSEL